MLLPGRERTLKFTRLGSRKQSFVTYVMLSPIHDEASEAMTFSIFEWRCPNIRGESLFTDILLVALGVLFAAGSFARNLKLGRNPGTAIPAPPHARVIIFMLGCLMVFEGTKLTLLCR
ncbi:MAG: hypothetical protein JWL65_2230 [Gammaproteobacteria bacterium]|nr:hypothetical protein [Gammaproteobacteria bacterium]